MADVKKNRREKWLEKYGPQYTYNSKCKNYRDNGIKQWCSKGCEMFFCSNKCAWCTNFAPEDRRN